MQGKTERPEILANPRSDRVKKVAGLAGRSARLRHGQFLVEGPQAVGELIRFRPDLVRDVYGTDAPNPAGLLDEASAARLHTHRVSDAVARAMSPDAQGILAVADIPGPFSLAVLEDARLAVVLPAIADPGNTGTLIRIADAAGADAVIVCHGGVEVTNPKVVRASAGSLFHLPVVSGVPFDDVVEASRGAGLALVGADGGATLSLFDDAFPADRPTAWVFGNEAHGLSDGERVSCDALVSIPLYGHAESLNVAAAAAVCLYRSATAVRR
ncbi:MAG TPA: RNA methyltransferase [Actinomycetaceae bacterium]|nr:RNA methyltransferase [Actinomycetaceae bacterium]